MSRSGATTREPGPGEVTVRDAEPGDARRLAGLLADGAITAKENPADAAPYRAAIVDITATPGNRVLVAERDGRVVGVLQLIVFRHLQEQGGWCAEIESVHVERTARSGGIGGVLMHAAIDVARAAGCYRVQLTSNVARPDAHRFYERLGFEGTHTGFKRYFPR